MQATEMAGILASLAIVLPAAGALAATRAREKAGLYASLAGMGGLVFLLGSWGILEALGARSLEWTGLWLQRLSLSVGCLVALLFGIVSRYAQRYLEGDAVQPRFFVWSQATASAVLLMILANNFILFCLAWFATSMGLHQLLLLHRQRRAARQTAALKFFVSRLGDLALLGAAYLMAKTLGTFHLPTILAEGTRQDGISLLLVIGAMTKSAQVPFHAWLPETIDTPTPVSALMHAGIINAGGYLILRLLPLISQSPIALSLLCLVGFSSIAIAGLSMLATPDVKRQLALSTSAQMGFMFVQIGLGLPTAALTHMIAHAFYKASCFLGSGELGRFRQQMQHWTWGGKQATALVFGLTVVPLMLRWTVLPGSLTLGQAIALSLLILTLASSLLLQRAVAVPQLGIVPFVGAALLFASHELGRWLLAASDHFPEASDGALYLILAGALGLFWIQRSWALWPASRRWALLTHARQGFYFHACAQYLLRKVAHV